MDGSQRRSRGPKGPRFAFAHRIRLMEATAAKIDPEAAGDGKPSTDGKPGTLESFNPTTGELLGTVQTVTPQGVQAVVDDVAEIQPAWAQLSLDDRAGYMRRAAQVIVDELDDITRLLTSEQGKPIAEAHSMEVIPTIEVLTWCADEGPKILADEKIPMGRTLFLTKKAFFRYEPIGVAGVIAPWNYPWSIPFDETAMALMAGNGVVLKPASLTPLLGERIVEVFEKAGLPEGIVRTVHGGGAVGQALVESTAGKIFFTGSVEVGRKVGELCAKLMKGSVLELGGKDPAIVCADADMAQAVPGVVWGGFANSGQTCSGIERVYVADQIADPYLAKLVKRTQSLKIGDPSDWDTEIGPMTSEEQFETVRELVDDAVASGAKMLCGGPVEVEGFPKAKFFAPTVLGDVTHEMRIMREEVFGPVLPIVNVAGDDEAVKLANDSDFGLGSSVWTRDRAKGERIGSKIQSGMVWVNDHSYSHAACQCSWGGVKDSGLGRSHSKFGFYECTNVKLFTWEPGRARDVWWHPYDRALGKYFKAIPGLLYGRGGQRLKALRQGGLDLLRVTARTLRKRA
jgi:acyl-CoA reductase-like NAD-dependent aldehyde dehydrogenase